MEKHRGVDFYNRSPCQPCFGLQGAIWNQYTKELHAITDSPFEPRLYRVTLVRCLQ